MSQRTALNRTSSIVARAPGHLPTKNRQPASGILWKNMNPHCPFTKAKAQISASISVLHLAAYEGRSRAPEFEGQVSEMDRQAAFDLPLLRLQHRGTLGVSTACGTSFPARPKNPTDYIEGSCQDEGSIAPSKNIGSTVSSSWTKHEPETNARSGPTLRPFKLSKKRRAPDESEVRL